MNRRAKHHVWTVVNQLPTSGTFVARVGLPEMNPYELSVCTALDAKKDLSRFGELVFSIGFVCLIPAALFSTLMIIALFFALSDVEILLRPRFLWSVGMSMSFVAFACSSLRVTVSPARVAMYILGAMTVSCAAMYDTYNVVELNAYSGNCGNPIAVGMMFRIACFSTYIGVPVVVIAALFGVKEISPSSEIGEP